MVRTGLTTSHTAQPSMTHANGSEGGLHEHTHGRSHWWGRQWDTSAGSEPLPLGDRMMLGLALWIMLGIVLVAILAGRYLVPVLVLGLMAGVYLLVNLGVV